MLVQERYGEASGEMQLRGAQRYVRFRRWE